MSKQVISLDWAPEPPSGCEEFRFFVATREVEIREGLRLGTAYDIGVFMADPGYQYMESKFYCLCASVEIAAEIATAKRME